MKWGPYEGISVLIRRDIIRELLLSLSTCSCTKERSCEKKAKRWPSVSQKSSHQNPTMPCWLASWSHTSSVQNCEKRNFCCLSQVSGILSQQLQQTKTASKRHGFFSCKYNQLESLHETKTEVRRSILTQNSPAKSLVSQKKKKEKPTKCLHYNIKKNRKLCAIKIANQKIHLYMINNILQKGTEGKTRGYGINIDLLHWAET